MSKTIINADKAPAAVGPYSHAAVVAGKVLFCSGQIGLVPGTKALAQGFEAEVRQAFANMQAVVEASGGSLADVAKLTLFLTDMAQFPIVNQIMAEVMPDPKPARSTVGVASLPLGAAFEVEAIAALA